MEAMLGDDKRSVNIGLQDEVIKENLLGHGGHYAILSSTLLFRSIMDSLSQLAIAICDEVLINSDNPKPLNIPTNIK